MVDKYHGTNPSTPTGVEKGPAAMISLTWIDARSLYRLAAALGLTLGLLTGLAPLRTQAALTGCRSDPIVTLSNGVQVQIGNTMADAAANVSKVAYTLHGPLGTTATQVVYPADNASGIVETFQYIADNQPGNYDSYSAIYDANAGINVNEATTVTNTTTLQSISQTAQTHLSSSGQSLHIHVHLN
jgi:hypothetical protein